MLAFPFQNSVASLLDKVSPSPTVTPSTHKVSACFLCDTSPLGQNGCSRMFGVLSREIQLKNCKTQSNKLGNSGIKIKLHHGFAPMCIYDIMLVFN